MKSDFITKEEMEENEAFYKHIESQMPSMIEMALQLSYRSMVADELKMMLDSFRNAERAKDGAGLIELEGQFRRMELNDTPYSPEQCAAMREAVENFDAPFELIFK